MNRNRVYLQLHEAILAYGEDPHTYTPKKNVPTAFCFAHTSPIVPCLSNGTYVFGLWKASAGPFFGLHSCDTGTRRMVDYFRFCGRCRQPFSLFEPKLNVYQRGLHIYFALCSPSPHDEESLFCGTCCEVLSPSCHWDLDAGTPILLFSSREVEDHMPHNWRTHPSFYAQTLRLIPPSVGRPVAERALRRMFLSLLTQRQHLQEKEMQAMSSRLSLLESLLF